MRFLTNDFVNRDPRALLNTGKIATLSETAIPIKQYITVIGSDTLQIEEGCIIFSCATREKVTTKFIKFR